MKIPVEWLKELVPVKLATAELAERLTMIGLEVGSVETVAGREVMDIEVTSNRPDCLSVTGIAREVSAMTGVGLRKPAAGVKEEGGRCGDTVRVDIEDPELCPRYAARLIEGVRLGASPRWMVDRLEACGVRALNNIVDATNYALMELGHPLHAFDFERLSDKRIVVRRARPGEAITTLDGLERKLDPEMLVIADGRRPVALAGIMGGQDSEVSERTSRVLLESACFAPGSIRRTARRLGMQTEASYRFERGADLEGLTAALDRTAVLLTEVAGGTVAAGVVDVYPGRRVPAVVALRPGRLREVLGARISSKVIRRILELLGFEVTVAEDGKKEMRVGVPGYRGDIEREVDLIEEVARHYGYGRIPSCSPQGSAGRIEVSALRKTVLTAREALVACGLLETVNTSFLAEATAQLLQSLPGGPVAVLNPMTEGQGVLRQSLVPGLLASAALNVSRGSADLALFEIGRTYSGAADAHPVEKTHAAVLLTGEQGGAGWADDRRPADFFALKGVAEGLLDRLRAPEAAFEESSSPLLDPGVCARLVAAGTEIGFAGSAAGGLREHYGLKQPAFVLEVVLDTVAGIAEADRRVRALPRYPSSRRDIAAIVSNTVRARDLIEAIRTEGGEWVEQVVLFDLYQGKQVPSGARSLAFAVHYRSPERTLTDEEIGEVHERILGFLVKQFKAEIRTGQGAA